MTFEEALIEYCAPTLAGLKVASLYRFFPQDPGPFAQQYKFWSVFFARRGLSFRILKGCRRTSSYLMYLYRSSELDALLSQPDIRAYLLSLGYAPFHDSETALRQLTQRLCLEQDFPHEIGLFLGYPLEDVQGFIQQNGQGYTCCGCWKSYGDPALARRRFSSYRSCTAAYKKHYANGTSLARLIVMA